MEEGLRSLTRACLIDHRTGCGLTELVDHEEQSTRHDLTDEEWAWLVPLLPADARQGRRWADHRRVVNGVFHRTRAGCPWRDVPERYGPWQTVYERHRRWSADGTWEAILDALRMGCDLDEGSDWTVAVDSTVVRAHQHAVGARQQPPKDVPAERLEPTALSTPVRLRGSTGGSIE
jgi:transposase